jgi:penicillin-binding protein 2
MACCIANRGFYVTPHIVRAIGDSTINYEKHNININKKHFDVVIDGMEQAITGGTAKGAVMDNVVVCGKTGTAQNPHGEDHSIFMVFAPRENPKIAMAIYIENGGFGATYAVPIGGLILEKYLNGEISVIEELAEERLPKGFSGFMTYRRFATPTQLI